MPLTPTALRSLVARQIKLSLAEAEEELKNAPPDRCHDLEALIDALRERLGKRREVVLAARQQSLMRGIFSRRRRFRTAPVWGFPNGYDPNQSQDRCDICRSINWQPRPVPGQDFTAWTCSTCPSLPQGIPNP